MMWNATNGTCEPLVPPGKSILYYVIGLITCSCVVCIFVLIFSTRRNKESFHKWKLIDRVGVYIAITDLLFYITQVALMVFLPILKTTKYYQVTLAICTLLFMEFAFAQLLMNIAITGSATALVFRNQAIPFGRYDWKMHVSMFGIPLVALVIIEITNVVERQSNSCDMNHMLNFQLYLFTISSSFIVLVFMYMGIWYHVVQTRKQIVAVLAHQTKTNAKRLGGKLSLYVLGYFIQFGGNVVEGFWRLFEKPPMIIEEATLVFVVSGGVLNGAIYFIINKMS